MASNLEGSVKHWMQQQDGLAEDISVVVDNHGNPLNVVEKSEEPAPAEEKPSAYLLALRDLKDRKMAKTASRYENQMRYFTNFMLLIYGIFGALVFAAGLKTILSVVW